jgi:integrase
VKVLVKVRKPKKRVAYTLEETKTILNALTRTDAKLFFALCSVLGMRPSEAAAVKWENIDFDGGVLKVREAAPYGVLGELKTEQSEDDLDIIEPVRSFLTAWHQEMKQPSVGLLFTPDGKHPINHSDFAKRWIKPEAEKVCPRYCGCYAGRHGTATDLYNQDGDVRAAYQVLRNSLEVVQSTYVKPKSEHGKAGLHKREQAFLKTTVTKEEN